MNKKILAVFLVVLPLLNCGSTLQREAAGIRTGRLNGGDGPMILASRKAVCSDLVSHRRWNWPFVVPVNQPGAAELKKIAEAPSIRVKEMLHWTDVAISAVGFLVGIVTRTVVYETCPTEMTLVSEKSAANSRRRHAAERRELLELRERNKELEARMIDKSNASIKTESGPATP